MITTSSWRLFCTYSSREKDATAGLLPAGLRYRSDRVRRVIALATRARVGFRILSGEYGLLTTEDPIPFYDHLLSENEVAALSGKVAKQLLQQEIRKVVYFTKPPDDDPAIAPYLATIQSACATAGARLETRHLVEEGNKPDSLTLMAEAERCKNMMLIDRTAGEELFNELIEQHAADGMVRLKRGEAYEVLREHSRALGDYEMAEALLPMTDWKATARDAGERVRVRLSPTQPAPATADVVLGSDRVIEVIGGVETLLSRAEGREPPSESLNDRLRRLQDGGLIPRNVANHMRYLMNTRNDVVHARKGEPLKGHAVATFLAAWSVVKEWANSAGLRIDDLP